jgi:hypothetical protein
MAESLPAKLQDYIDRDEKLQPTGKYHCGVKGCAYSNRSIGNINFHTKTDHPGVAPLTQEEVTLLAMVYKPKTA